MTRGEVQGVRSLTRLAIEIDNIYGKADVGRLLVDVLVQEKVRDGVDVYRICFVFFFFPSELKQTRLHALKQVSPAVIWILRDTFLHGILQVYIQQDEEKAIWELASSVMLRSQVSYTIICELFDDNGGNDDETTTANNKSPSRSLFGNQESGESKKSLFSARWLDGSLP